MAIKTKYKFISFEIVDGKSLKQEYNCLNNKSGSILGYVEYYKPWKQYVIDFLEDCVFNSSCLKDIADFLHQLNKDQ